MRENASKREILSRRIDRLTEDEAGEVLDYISVMESLRNNTEESPLDELIVRLLVEASLTGAKDSILKTYDEKARLASSQA